MSEPMEPVELTLNESGYLCNLVVREIALIEQAKPTDLYTPQVLSGVLVRTKVLYHKLATANDKLMEKT